MWRGWIHRRIHVLSHNPETTYFSLLATWMVLPHSRALPSKTRPLALCNNIKQHSIVPFVNICHSKWFPNITTIFSQCLALIQKLWYYLMWKVTHCIPRGIIYLCVPLVQFPMPNLLQFKLKDNMLPHLSFDFLLSHMSCKRNTRIPFLSICID